MRKSTGEVSKENTMLSLPVEILVHIQLYVPNIFASCVVCKRMNVLNAREKDICSKDIFQLARDLPKSTRSREIYLQRFAVKAANNSIAATEGLPKEALWVSLCESAVEKDDVAFVKFLLQECPNFAGSRANSSTCMFILQAKSKSMQQVLWHMFLRTLSKPSNCTFASSVQMLFVDTIFDDSPKLVKLYRDSVDLKDNLHGYFREKLRSRCLLSQSV